jgi:hypothetical protein
MRIKPDQAPAEELAAGAAEAIAEPAPAPPAPAATIETWAEKRGHLPMWQPQPSRFLPKGAPVPVAPNPEYWKFAAAKALRNWPVGAEVTEAEFIEAVELAAFGTFHG